ARPLPRPVHAGGVFYRAAAAHAGRFRRTRTHCQKHRAAHAVIAGTCTCGAARARRPLRAGAGNCPPGRRVSPSAVRHRLAQASMAQASSSRPTPLAGIACVLAGVLFLTISDALAKWIGQYYSPLQILFLRAAIAFPFVLALVVALGGRPALRTRHLTLHLLRGALNIISACFFYMGLRALPLAENTAIAFAAPLFVTALSVLVLKEKVDGRRWLAVGIGFA